MKKHFVLVIALVLAYGVAQASPSDYGISIGYGSADTNIDIYRVGLQKDFSSKWFETRVGYLTGYFELSYNYWESENHDKTNGIALSPVFTYYFGSSANSIKPYIEGGIGVAYIDDYMIDGRNLATNFQFEDRLGAGIRFKQIDVSARYMHYSNCSVKSPNDGIDIFICSISYRF
jgi:lipid A 3-O-deacylase